MNWIQWIVIAGVLIICAGFMAFVAKKYMK
ncbi:hypothetical protein IJ22_34280 [Paenibacillus naphthalenovorans]|uniref:Uncharacterized protein n=1 Tax=Paenibacillus naphthalenovorans TaxID=162209 RepID=A0A0U2W8P0_9BACL|nr:hypothetical protein IJ22_34280 [Paenibacillus naphthalenovorans]SDJ67434.1 hypothetical protein SAMN05421868_13716 [Paenibacillus naphthalenovorans]